MSYQAVVAQYHVESSSDNEEDHGSHEKEGLMLAYKYNRHGRHYDKWEDHEPHQSFAMNAFSCSSEEDLDVARAREELDGLRRPSRPFNPLTIIQVKNAERNLDDGGGGSGSGNCCLLSSYYIASHPKPKFIFTVSLLAGLAMIGLAVWVLPTHHCGDSSRLLCQVHASASKAAAVQTRLRRETYWTKSYDNITLTSGLEVVEDSRTGLQTVVSGFSNNVKSLGNFGLLALRPEDGTEVWRRELQAKPHKHDCNLLDVNGDNRHDCIVVGEHGLMAAIDPHTGLQVWSMRYHMPLVNISLPRRLPDLDGDRISEMIAACAVTFPSEMTDNHVHVRTNFILISGRQGQILGRPYLVDTCTDIGAINVTSNLALQFDCTSQHGPDQFEMSLDEFYSKATNQPSQDFVLNEGLAGHAAKYRQFSVIGEDPAETVKDSIHLDWSPLKPHCAECGVTVKMWDSFAHRPLWQQTWPRAVAFQPLSTRYETERPDSPIEGFLFRLWQYPSQAFVGDTFTIGKTTKAPPMPLAAVTSISPALPSEESATGEDKNSSSDEDEQSIFTLYRENADNFAQEEEEENRQRNTPPYEVVISNLMPFGRPNLRGLLSYKSAKQSFNSVQDNLDKPRKNIPKSRWLNVTETIYYATLNHSSPQVIALFQHTLLQECVQDRPFQAYHCLPHYNTMPNSMVIVEHSPDGPDWRDVIFATHSLEKEPRRQLRTSIHRLKLSKDIQRVTPVN